MSLQYIDSKNQKSIKGSISSFVDNFLTKRKGKKEYEEKLIEFLSDNVLDDSEKKELGDIASSYNLKLEDLVKAQRRSCSMVFSKITKDKRIDEDEKKALESLMTHFQVKTEDFDFSQKTFNKYYTLGLLEKGILPNVKCEDFNIILKKDEILHWVEPAEYKKFKRTLQGLDYWGPRASFRIMKGFSYRVGSYGISTRSSEELVTDDEGCFWITNKRVGFQGSRKNFAANYNQILSFDLSEYGLLVRKTGRDNPYILKLKDKDIPCMILSHIVNNLQ
jgi:hypothetical protein